MVFTGLERNSQAKVEKLLAHFPAVAILGARQVGKTTLAKKCRPHWKYIDLEKSRDVELVSNDVDFFFEREPRDLIIDEAQNLPLIFNALRGVIDQARTEKNRFILTGSSSPELIKQISESLAGRIAIVELGTLKTNEIFSQPLSPFYQIFAQPLSRESLATYVPSTPPPLSRDQIHQAWLKGGYPEPLLASSEWIYQEWMDNYRDTYINRDIARLFPRLNKIAYQRFITLLGKISGTIINKAELGRAIEVSEKSIREYLAIAEGTYLWRQLLSFENDITKSVVKMPKGHLQDTGLLHFLLKITSLDSLYADPIVGHSFESFVIEEVIKGLQASPVANWEYYYYRTKNQAEIDFIIQGPFGLLPIEIKYGTKVDFRQLKTLGDFAEKHRLPFGILINQSQEARWLTPHIFQLPVGWV